MLTYFNPQVAGVMAAAIVEAVFVLSIGFFGMSLAVFFSTLASRHISTFPPWPVDTPAAAVAAGPVFFAVSGAAFFTASSIGGQFGAVFAFFTGLASRRRCPLEQPQLAS